MVDFKQAGSIVIYALGIVCGSALARIGWEVGEKIWAML
jgi:hypothetical protein